MKPFTQPIKAALLSFSLLSLTVGCTKEDVVENSSSPAAATVAPKSLPFFLDNTYPGQTNTFGVVLFGTCITSYGEIHPDAFGTPIAPNNLIIPGSPSYVRVSLGSCTLDANYLRLKRGSTAGSYGPYYLIIPANGPSPKKMLKVRVKNVTNPANDYYEGEFVYNNVTNTWTSMGGTDAYEWTTVTTLPPLCPPRL